MNWFSYLLHLSVIYFVFGHFWKRMIAIPFTVLLLTVNEKVTLPIVMADALNFYCLAAFTAYNRGSYSMPIFVLGSFFLLFQTLLNVFGRTIVAPSKRADDIETLFYSVFVVLFGFICYCIMYFSHQTGITPVIEWFTRFINQISSLSILKRLIVIGSLLNALYIIFYGFIGILSIKRLIEAIWLVKKTIKIRYNHKSH